MKKILITGDRSGSGKTSITLALAALLSRNNQVQTFKVGMDYIDPSYLSAVSGRPCRNLDSFTLSDKQNREIFQYGCRGADIALVEGVRGLYEGAEALNDTGSTCICCKITRSSGWYWLFLPRVSPGVQLRLLKDFRYLIRMSILSGVILNNVKGDSHKEKALKAIEHYCGIPVIGAIPRMEEMQLAMRHLGLVPLSGRCRAR